jgi:hypothetical protein
MPSGRRCFIIELAQETRALGHDRRAFIALLRLRFISSHMLYPSFTLDSTVPELFFDSSLTRIPRGPVTGTLLGAFTTAATNTHTIIA